MKRPPKKRHQLGKLVPITTQREFFPPFQPGGPACPILGHVQCDAECAQIAAHLGNPCKYSPPRT